MAHRCARATAPLPVKRRYWSSRLPKTLSCLFSILPDTSHPIHCSSLSCVPPPRWQNQSCCPLLLDGTRSERRRSHKWRHVMDSPKARTGKSKASEETQVRLLYQDLLRAWNEKNARKMADFMAENGNLVGFDGSQIDGRQQVESVLRKIFGGHPTAAYIAIVREVRLLSPNVALLRAVAGMVPPGQTDINPAVNAVQSLIATKEEGRWRIALFHNTPAAFHGRPELSA